MVDSIKITALQDIGANIAYTTLVPLVNMAGTPTTQKANLQNLGNLILNGAGGSYFPRAAQATLALSVANAAQPNITSVGSLTSLAVTGNITAGNINGGNIVVANFYYGDGRFLTNVVANSSYSNSNVAAYLPTFTGNIGAGNISVTGTSNLGAVGNIIITGGSAGQKLTTDGAGNLTWTNDANSSYGNTDVANYLPTFTGIVGANAIHSTESSGSNVEINANGAVFTFGQGGALYWPAIGGGQKVIETNIDGEFEIKSTANVVISTDITNVNSHFTFDSTGVFTSPGNVNLLGSRLNVGPDAASAGNLLNPTLVIANTGAQYIQAAIINNDGAGSSDWSADGAGGGDDEAWTDMGFAGFSFNDANFSITEPGDGYLFVQSYANGLGGNMVLATGDHSNTADIIFATGGFLANNEFARIDHANDVFHLTRAGSGIKFYDGTIQTTAGGGGGTGSELVNGDNSFTLQSNGNVVLSGSEGGVNRGLVWDYGAVANGVNSEVRQDINGLSVRAWTEAGGPGALYAAPVNIVTNQDANINTWKFDSQGNLTVPGNINSISDGGDLGAYLTLTPDLGLARLAGREVPANVNYTNTSWSTATYTGTQIDFTNAPDLIAFFTNNTFNAGVNQTISINGGEPVPFTGYTTGVSNAVTVYTSVTADPDPTTVTSIDFSSQLESYVAVDYDAGTLNVNATGLTINIDNDQTSGPDINLRSGDDILLQAKDKALGSESEGGDINILAGDGADDDGAGNISSTGGDIQITAGNGGDGNSSSGSAGGFTQIYGGTGGTAGVTNTAGPGGYVSINGGDGGFDTGNTQLGAGGGYVSIAAGLSTQEGVNGPNVTITSGQGGPNALAGSVVISTPASVDGPGGDWVFDGYGNLILPNNSNIATIGNVTQFNTCSNGFLGLNSYDAGGNNIASIAINSIDGLVGISTYDPITDSDYHWAFDVTGNLTLPGNTFTVNYANGTPVSIGGGGNTGNVTFSNVTVQGDNNGLNLSAGADFTANLAYLQVRAGDVASHIHLDTGNNSAYDLIVGDDQNYVQVSSTGNILLSSYDSNTAQYTWTLDYNGNLILAGGNSVIQSIANSSLDPINPNVSTMILTPDPGYSSQSLVLDPTAPGHIHLRAPGANIDEPAANIFLGGEDTSFEVTYGANNEARIHSGANDWTFGNDGNLTIPGTSGGFIKTVSNASIGIAAVDNGTNNPAQLLSLNAGTGAATSIVSAYSTNVAIQTNATGTINTWEFDNTGNLTIPGSLIAITASPSPTINGFSITNSMGISGNGNISTAGTITATGKIGYSTGGNATQSSTGAGVTINQLTGLVTLANRTYNAGDLEAFSISCNKVSNDDFVLVQMVDSVNAPSYNVVAYPNFVLANTISVLVKTLENVGTDTPILKFMIVKAPIS